MKSVYMGENFTMLDIIDHIVIIKDQDIIIIAVDKLCPVYLSVEDIFKIQKYQRKDYDICPTLKIGKHLEVELHFDWTVIKDCNNQVAIKPTHIVEVVEYLKKLDKEEEKENER